MRYIVGFLIFSATTASAQITPPTVRRVSPLVVRPGEKTTIEITGSELDGATALVFDDAHILASTPEKAKDGAIHAEITIPASVTALIRPFRVVTPNGISSAVNLGIGRALPGEKEKEPNDGFKTAQTVRMPIAIEGAINTGNDVDLFAVDARRGETLVAEVIAARVGSDLDSLVTIFSPDGRELASDDDRFGRDSTAWAAIPEDGRYIVQIQDANGQVNNTANPNPTRDYVMSIGRLPVVTAAFPPGGRRGQSVLLRIDGVNLPENEDFRWTIPGDATPGDSSLRLDAPLGVTNPVALRIGEAPEIDEPVIEPADDPLHAIVVTVPAAVNGRFQRLDDGDVDLFRLKAAPGQDGDFAVTAFAAKVGSAADPVLTVIDDKGDSQAEDDDTLGRDAYIERRIDSESGILIAVRDAFRRGGDRFVYRIEVQALPKVVVTADLGERTMNRGCERVIPLTFARHGYDGPLSVEAAPLTEGLSADAVTIDGKSKGANLVLRSQATAALGAFPLALTIRDVPWPVSVVFKEQRAGQGNAITTDSPLLCVAEPASLGISADRELTVARGGQADWKLTFDRRGDAAKKPLKVRILAADGDLDGLEFAKEATVNADTNEFPFTFKARPDAAPRRVTIAARAWFDGSTDSSGIDASTTLVIPE